MDSPTAHLLYWYVIGDSYIFFVYIWSWLDERITAQMYSKLSFRLFSTFFNTAGNVISYLFRSKTG